MAGGGIYSTTTDYTKLLQELLRLFRIPEDQYSKNPLLTRRSVRSLFEGTLPESAKESVANIMNMRPPQAGDSAASGEWDWSTGMVVWSPKDGRRLGKDDQAEEGGWGRRTGSCGWFGAAGTMYFIDPQSNLTVSFSNHHRVLTSCICFVAVRLYYADATRQPPISNRYAECFRETSVCGITRIIGRMQIIWIQVTICESPEL